MKHLCLIFLFALFVLPVCAQNVAGSAQKPADQAPRVRVMPFLPYANGINVDYTKRGRIVSDTNAVVSKPSNKASIIEKRAYNIVFDDASTKLNDAAVGKIKQAAAEMRRAGFKHFALYSYYREGNRSERSLAYKRLEIVNDALNDVGMGRTFQSYAEARKQIVVNKNTVIIVPR